VDSAHFPFVHRSYLGEEPYTEVRLDECSVQDDGTIYSRCSCFQNYQPAGGESAGTFIEYEYRIYSPLVVALFKANGEEPARKDCVAQFVQAVDEETCIAHSTLAYLPHNMTEHRIRWYMQLITGQDKPILENQVPKRLPLNLRDEVSVRADGMSVAYRRRLKGLSIGYGAIVHP
jgi:phenylpropionate dioxygenase-like ring-hydroxylating dioxygenase large terminal subunit